jgi:hypothetical protein
MSAYWIPDGGRWNMIPNHMSWNGLVPPRPADTGILDTTLSEFSTYLREPTVQNYRL